MIICLDPGHGGDNHGTQDDGFRESEIVYDIARLLEEMLLDDGHAVSMTREADQDPSLEDRQALANEVGAHLFVSIHVNATKSPLTSGTMVFYRSGEMAETVARAITKVSELTHGNPLWETSDCVGPGKRWLARADRCIRHCEMPALLVECGFRTNSVDRWHLLSVEGQLKMAKAIYESIIPHD